MISLSQLLLSIEFLIVFVKCSTRSRPNFVFILADDLDFVFNSSHVMDNLYKYIGNEGIIFNNGFISTPICCPSRTETITGRAYQNIGPPNGNCMHIETRSNIFNNTFSWFQIYFIIMDIKQDHLVN